MPNWKNLLDEVKAVGGAHDVVRRGYLARLSELTGRNTIVYYSGWLQKPGPTYRGIRFDVNDADKNAFMTTIHGLDRSKGLDLVLHTPGGSVAATESLVDYLHSMFGGDIRVVVPQLAMSAGTMIACSAREIVMGKHSSLGPIDPQIAGLPAHGILEEFHTARQEIQASPAAIPIWQPIIAKYSPTLIGECQKAIQWSEAMVKDWLVKCMFDGDPEASVKADAVVAELGDHALTKSHERHISLTKARSLGLKVVALEDHPGLQDAVLSVHHACIQTLTQTSAFKITENQNGVAFIETVATVLQLQQQ